MNIFKKTVVISCLLGAVHLTAGIYHEWPHLWFYWNGHRYPSYGKFEGFANYLDDFEKVRHWALTQKRGKYFIRGAFPMNPQGTIVSLKFLESNEIIQIPDNLQQSFTRVVHSRGFEGLFVLDQDVFFEVPDKMCGVVATSDIRQALEKINNKYHQADYNELEGEWYVYFE